MASVMTARGICVPHHGAFVGTVSKVPKITGILSVQSWLRRCVI